MTLSFVGKRCAGGQILGARSRQEDVYRILEFGAGGVVLVLSDGMGGHSGGKEAADCVVERCTQSIEAADGSLGARLRPALDEANAALAALKIGHRKWLDAGCTLLAAAVEDDRLSWISVGDSPLYLVRNGALRQLNDDHSMRPVFAELAAKRRTGTVTDSEENPNRNALRSAVVGERLEIVDERTDALELQAGDVLLAASDGIEVLALEAIAQLLSDGTDATALTERLLRAVTDADHPRQDNTTVLVYLFE